MEIFIEDRQQRQSGTNMLDQLRRLQFNYCTTRKLATLQSKMSIYNDLTLTLEEKLGRGERRVGNGPLIIMK